MAQSITLGLSPDSDSGAKGDGITDFATPAFTGTAYPGATVTVKIDGTVAGTTTADPETGMYSFSYPGALTDGSFVVTAEESGTLGPLPPWSPLPVVSPNLNLTIDTTPPPAPSLPVLAPASDTGVKGDNVTSNDSPTLTGTAEAGDTVNLYIGDNQIGTGTADSTGAWSIDTGPASLAEGKNGIIAIATDPAGNTGPVSPALVVTLDATLDTTPPNAPAALTLSPDSDSDSGKAGDNLTSVTTPTITGTAEAGDTVNLYGNGTQIGTGTADQSGAWSITASTPLTEGLNSLTANAIDPAGNQSADSSPLSVTLDTTAPGAPTGLTLASADHSGPPGGDVTSNTLPTINGSAEAGDTVALYDGATQIGTGTVDESGAWSITAGTPLTEGANSLTAIATDPAGNASGASSPLDLTLNTAPKDFAYTVPATAEAGVASGSPYSGPVSYLQEQYLYTGTDGIAMITATPNVFIHGGPGDDALVVSAGSNVLDGGAGSNFLTGGTGADGGKDTFFDDGRSGQTVWDTIVNFHQGDAAVIWGFNKDVSTLTWADNQGAAGFQGATLHSELGGAGTGVNASFTLTGMTVADAQANIAISNGTTADGTPYLYLQHT